MVVGDRFLAFSPVGSRAYLDNDLIAMAEAYQFHPVDTMKLTCTRRHKLLRAREHIVRMSNQAAGLHGGRPKTGIG